MKNTRKFITVLLLMTSFGAKSLTAKTLKMTSGEIADQAISGQATTPVPPIASDAFMASYLQISETILQSITDLRKARQNTLRSTDLKPNDLFRQVKDRLEISTKYRFEGPPLVTDFEKTTWKGLVDVLIKLVETSDTMAQNRDNSESGLTDWNNWQTFDGDLNDTINLFAAVIGASMDQLPSAQKIKLQALLQQYPPAPQTNPGTVSVGLSALTNTTNDSTAPQFLQNLMYSYLSQSDKTSPLYANGLNYNSSSSDIAQYAAAHGLNYVLTGKITKFENNHWQTNWMWGVFGHDGWAIHIEGTFNLYDRTGKLIASTSQKADNVTTPQVDASTWLASGLKFMHDKLGPWLHQQLNVN